MILTSSSGEVIRLTDVQRMHLMPGDKILVTVAQPLTKKSRERVIAFFQGVFPGHTCIVADSGAIVEVIHEEKVMDDGRIHWIGPSETFDK